MKSRKNLSLWINTVECVVCICAVLSISPVSPLFIGLKYFSVFVFVSAYALTLDRLKVRKGNPRVSWNFGLPLHKLCRVSMLVLAVPIIGYVGTSDLLCRTDILGNRNYLQAVDAQVHVITLLEGEKKAEKFLDRISLAQAQRAERSESMHRYDDAVDQYGLAEWAAHYNGRDNFDDVNYDLAIAHCFDLMHNFDSADPIYWHLERDYNEIRPSDPLDKHKFVSVFRILRLLQFVDEEELKTRAPYLVEAIALKGKSARQICNRFYEVPTEPESICPSANSPEQIDSVWLDLEEVQYKLYKVNPECAPQVVPEFTCLYPLPLDERYWFDDKKNQTKLLSDCSLFERWHNKWNFAPLNRRVWRSDVDLVLGKRIILTAEQNDCLNDLSGIASRLGVSRYSTQYMQMPREYDSFARTGTKNEVPVWNLHTGANNAKSENGDVFYSN